MNDNSEFVSILSEEAPYKRVLLRRILRKTRSAHAIVKLLYLAKSGLADM